MKTLIISGLCTLSLALPVAGADYQFVVADNQLSSKMCVQAASNQKHQLNNTIKLSRLSHQFVANKIRCNDINITAFAYQYKAHKTHKLLSHYYQGRVDITDIVLGDSMGFGQPALVTSINAEQ